MKHLRYLLMLALVAMPLTACDEDDDTTPIDIEDPVIHGTVSGTVSIEGVGVAGVSVSLVGATSQTATTGSGGGYSFANVEGGSYGVAISGTPADATFATSSATTSITTDGQTVTVDFSGNYIRTSSIAGQVMADGMGIAGVSVTATGPEGDKSAVTDNAGNYSFSGLRAGDYSISITNVPAAYSFTTATQNVTVGTGEAKIVGFFGTEIVTVDPVTASVVIKSVTTGATNVPVVPSNVAGQIDVTLQIDPGENDLTKIALLLNGAEVASQTLSNTVAERPVMEQGGIFEVVFSINTAVFDGNTFMATYPNGIYQLAAELGLDNALETAVATSIDLTFNNIDTFRAMATPTMSMIGTASSSNAGALYYGGGPIVVDVYPVIYTGRTVASVTTGFTDTGAGGTTAVTDAAAPFSFSWTLAGYASAFAAGTGNEAFTVTAATYTDGTTFGPGNGGAGLPIAVTGGTNFFVDNAAPPAGVLALTNQVTADAFCCSNNWVSSAYTPADGYTAPADNAGASIGGVTGQVFAGAATATNASIAGGTAITTIGDAGLAATLVSTTYTMVHVETDAFGNANTATRMVASADNGATTFGIDDTEPNTQAYTGQADWLINPAAAGTYAFAGTEDKSGFSTDYIRAREALFNTGGTTYPNIGVNNPGGATHGNMLNYPNTLVGPTVASTEGYYTFEGYILNQAGGAFGTTVTRHTLIDVTVPVAQNVQIPGSLVGGALTTFTAPVTDNLDLVIGDFDFQFGAATTAFWPFGDPAGTDRILGTAWDDVLTTSATATATVNFVSSVELNALPAAGAIVPANFVRVGAVDAAGNKSVVQVNNFAVGTVTPTATSFSAGGMASYTIATTPAVAAATNLCNGSGAACAAADTKSLTATLTITGPAGTYAPPFIGGYIYLYVNYDGGDATLNTLDDTNLLVGRMAGGTGVVTDTGATRTYTYTFTIDSADVAGVPAGTPINILAIGVNGSGAGILSTVDATFTVVAGS
jgi:hypothetical protein